MIFEKKQKIGIYTVTFPHKKGSYAETYRVKNEEGKILFLKLITCARKAVSDSASVGSWRILPQAC